MWCLDIVMSNILITQAQTSDLFSKMLSYSNIAKDLARRTTKCSYTVKFDFLELWTQSF